MAQPEKQPSEQVVDKQPAPAADAVDAATKDISIESIGWLFIQKYYSSYTTDIGKLFGFYDANAAISHECLPSETTEVEGRKQKTVHVANGSDAVKAFFEAQSAEQEKNKIIVESATFQNSIDDSILIVVSGCWKAGASPLWLFVQTFVLKAKGKTVYDVVNDVLKFFDLSEDYKQTVVVKNTVEPVDTGISTPPASEPSVAESPKSEPAEEQPAKAEEEIPAEETPVPAASEEKKEAKPAVAASSPAVAAAVAATESTEAPKPAVPAQKPTWATLAAIEPKKAPKVASLATPATSTATTAPVAARKAVSPSQAAPGTFNTNSKYKKEEWFTIYIKNVEVEEDELKAALTKNFGEIKFFKRSNKTALCDFRNREDQQKALEAKEIVVRNNVILLEPRVHKTYYQKPDNKKDKKQVKKNGLKKN